MPDLSFSSGITLGLVAGIVSGVCYLVANGLVGPRNDKVEKKCLPATRDEICLGCGGDQQDGIIPCICHKKKSVKFESGAWFLRQVQRTLSQMPWTVNTERLELIEEECEGESPGSDTAQRELRNVREFLEAIAAKLTGGPLEGTRVAPLYDHPAFLLIGFWLGVAIFLYVSCHWLDEIFGLPTRASQSNASNQQPSGASSAHAQLKRLVARVVEEAAALPALARYAAEPTTPSDASTYEDLLATAILNKVIERYQTEGSGGRSSGIHSASASPTPSERSSPRCLNTTRDITPPLREEDEISDWEEGAADETFELPRRVPFPEFGGDIVHNTDTEERDFDEVSCNDIQAVDGTWEENWLFQKKKIRTLQSVPVPMLVPNPNTDYKALIGDRDADDTTDLSDNASDTEDGAYESHIKRVLDSKHVIGGKPKIDDLMDYEPDSLTIIDDIVESDVEDDRNDECVNNRRDYIANNTINETKKENGADSVLIIGIDSGPMSKAEFVLHDQIHRSLLNGTTEEYAASLNSTTNGEANHDEVDGLANHTVTDAESTNTLSRHEKEGEYEETVSVPVQRYADSLRRKHFDDEHTQILTRDKDKQEDLIPGTIAYRERKKWLNAVDMPNNPYSLEAIQKRLSAKSTSSLFDIMTSSRELDDDRSVKSEDILEKRDRDYKKQETPQFEEKNNKEMMQLNLHNISLNGDRSKSPSLRVLKDVIAEDVPQYKRYGRDYYIKEAKKSAGGKKSLSETSSVASMHKTMSMSLDNFDAEFASTELLIKQFNTIASNQQYTKFSLRNDNPDSIKTSSKNNKSTVWIEYDDVNEQKLFNENPALDDEDTDKKFEEILQSAYNTEVIEKYGPISPSLNDSLISSSSLDDSIKIYNVQSGKVVKSKETDTLSRYDAAATDIDTADKSARIDNEDRLQNTVSPVSDESLKYEHLITISELDEILPQLPKVKELAKKFVSMDNLTETETKPQQTPRRRKSKETILNDKTDLPRAQYMHSLTARSISREFREGLKLSMATPITNPGGSKEVPDGEVAKESSRPGSPVPEPGTTKMRLAFFESLRSKFSSK